MWQQYYLASSVDDALDILEQWRGQARLIAGGTDVLIDVREGKYQPACLVDISRIPGMDTIEEDETFIIVGACTTFHNLWTSPLIQQKAHLLAEAAGHLGAWSIQNIATLGGNVVTAQPAGDGSIALLALGAEAEIASRAGRRWVAVSSLFAGPGISRVDPHREMITRFRWRKPGPRQASAYERIAQRETMALPIACCGVELQLTEDLERIAWARIAMGPVAETPLRMVCAEDFLRDAPCREETYAYAAEQAAMACSLRTSRLRATREYREEIVGVLVRRALRRAVELAKGGEVPRPAGRFKPAQPWSDAPWAPITDGRITFTLNGQEISLAPKPDATLAQVLREELGLTGTKVACNEGDCGACTVLVDGQTVVSCLYPVFKVHGRRVQTIEGMAQAGQLHPVQQALVCHDAVQCGYCTPGMVLTAVSLLQQIPEPTTEEIKRGLGNNYCRCTGYVKIVEAIKDASKVLSGHKDGIELRATPRKDAYRRVTGAEVYAGDMHIEGMLYGKVVWSAYPHAEILGIDTSEAEAVPGVVRVITWRDVPGQNLFGSVGYDQPVLAKDRVLFVGDAVAVVYAETLAAAEEGSRKVRVEYRELPGVFTPEEALRPDAPILKGSDNVFHRTQVQKGDIREGFAQADVVVEGEFTTPPIEHLFLETEAGIGVLEGDTVVLYQATQWPSGDRQQIADILGLPQERVRIVQTPVGGAFGGKMDLTIQPYLALGAYLTGRPVKIALSREESIRRHVKRHAFWMHYKLGATRDGRFVALEAHLTSDGGAYRSTSDDVIEQATVFASGPYSIPHVRVSGISVRTNNVPSGAMRGFGANQPCFAMESLIDELARKLGMDPFTLRRKNMLEEGSELVTGQILRHSVGAKPVLDAAEKALRAMRLPEPRPGRRIGVGVAAGMKNVGLGIGGDDSVHAAIELQPDGTFLLRHGAIDLGQGANTVMCQIAAKALGVSYDLIRYLTGDTQQARDGGITAASRQTYVTGRAILEASQLLRSQVIEFAAQAYGVKPERLLLTQNGQFLDLERETPVGNLENLFHLAQQQGKILAADYYHRPPPTFRILSPEQRQALGLTEETYLNYPALCYMCHVAIVEVDEETGQVNVLRFIAAHDVGRAINRTAVEGQIEGAVIMGLGYALSEEFVQERGRILSDRMHKIMVQRSTVPVQILPIIVEDPDPGGPFGAKGLAEAGAVPTAPAVCNAIYDAVGVRIKHLPATKERVLLGMKKKA